MKRGKRMKKALSLVLIAVLLLGLLPQVALASGSTLLLCYDDHVDITGKQVQIVDAGPSVITLDGNYLVATGVGNATVRIDGILHPVTVGKAKLNLIMIMGQSNSGNHQLLVLHN
jgi:hypothetical protein